MNITIKDVAKRAHVSVATVSRVINNKNNVSSDATSAVKRVIDEMGYKPNYLGRDLRKSETKRILVIIPSAEQSFYAEVLKGMEDKAFELQYDVLIGSTHDNAEQELHLLGMLFSHIVDGAIILSPRLDVKTLNKLGEMHNIALCLERLNKCTLLTVTIDNVKSSRDAVNYLINKGNKRVGLISTESRSQSSIDREDGYKLALEDNGIAFNPRYIYQGDYRTESGYKGCEYLLELENPPTAIFSISDTIAIGAMNYAMSNGLQVGKEIMFFGFDNTANSRLFSPHLSTVEQPCYLEGKLVMEKVIKNFQTDIHDKGFYSLPHSLILRESTSD